jgi:integrase
LPTKKITDLFVENAKAPTKGRVQYFDASFPGLCLRISHTGAKSWSLFYRQGGRLRRFTLGAYPAIKPAKARKEAQAALDQVRQGADPIAEKAARRDVVPTSVRGVFEDYLSRYADRNTAESTAKETRRVLEKDVLSLWGDRPFASITRRDAKRLLEDIVARGAPVHANRVLAKLRAVFNWAVAEGTIEVSPLLGMRPLTKEEERERVLSEQEIVWFWRACDEVGWPFGPMAQLLLLTAQRRDEVAGMQWPELDLAGRAWRLPGERTKNGRAHEIHLSDMAMGIIEALPRIGSHYVFTTNGTTHVSGYSKAKERLDKAMVRARRRAVGLPEDDDEYRKAMKLPAGKPLPVEITPWILHDLRRTATTYMAGKLKVAPQVADRVLNHSSGTIRGVAAIYNKYEYLDERTAALDAWSRFVIGLVKPAPSNVVPIKVGA